MKRKDFLPFARPLVGEEENKEIIDVLKSGWLSSGPKTCEFEKKISEYVGCNYSIAVNSCTAALHLSLIGLDVGKGDEVITSPFTFAATGNTIIHSGAKPVFADIKADTYNIDPEEIMKKITSRTKAIIPVHYAGQPCEMDEIMKIAKKNDLCVIEDAAHALGSKYKNKKIGTIGDTSCFSFYAVKGITTGDGGMITTNNEKLAEKLHKLSWHGIDKIAWKRYSSEGSWYYEVEYAGYKYNLTDIQSALGVVQLSKLDGFIKKRREYSKIYDNGFEDIEEITIPYVKKDIYHSRLYYPILIDKLKIDRNEFIEEMNKMNIGTSVHFIPLHFHPFYQKELGYKKGDFPVTESIYEKIVSLPLYPAMNEEDVNYVIGCVKDIIGGHRS